MNKKYQENQENYYMIYNKLINIRYQLRKINFCEGHICNSCELNSKYFKGCEVNFIKEKIDYMKGKLEKILNSSR